MTTNSSINKALLLLIFFKTRTLFSLVCVGWPKVWPGMTIPPSVTAHPAFEPRRTGSGTRGRGTWVPPGLGRPAAQTAEPSCGSPGALSCAVRAHGAPGVAQRATPTTAPGPVWSGGAQHGAATLRVRRGPRGRSPHAPCRLPPPASSSAADVFSLHY